MLSMVTNMITILLRPLIVTLSARTGATGDGISGICNVESRYQATSSEGKP